VPSTSHSIFPACHRMDWLALVKEACRSSQGRGFSSSVVSVEEWDIWIRVRFGGKTPGQGWKLHVSASVIDAAEVLRRVVPILVSEAVDFKLAKSSAILCALNNGEYGLPQVGKFISIYPENDDQALRLASCLHRVTNNLYGPAILSDRAFDSSGIVYYRYGAFDDKVMQAASGEIVPVFRSATGDYLPDRRALSYCPPEGIIDPFEASAFMVGLDKPNPLVANRYLITGVIDVSPRGKTYLAADLQVPRRCILKQARRHSSVDDHGRDGAERLRHEAAILNILQNLPGIPTVLDILSDDEQTYLIIEDIEGTPLDVRVLESSRAGTYPSRTELLQWGRELAQILGTIHSKGIVHRDLKLAHVVITSGNRLALLDFDLAFQLDSTSPPIGQGTRGYMSPQQRAGEKPSVAHDVYGFGALLYGLSTCTEPALAPNPENLFTRPPRLLNPTLSSEWIERLARCVHPKVEDRYRSVQDVKSWLDAMTNEDREFESTLTVESYPKRIGQEKWARKSAVRVADTLCRAAQKQPNLEGVSWTSRYRDFAGYQIRDLAVGSAGGVLALAKLSALGAALHLETLELASKWLVGAPRFAGSPLAGLYLGEAGVGLALLRSGQVLHDNKWIEAALAIADFTSTLPFASPDLYHGSAGRARFHLELWHVTGEKNQIRDSRSAGEDLLSRMTAVPSGTYWTIPAGYGALSGKTYFGYAHGAAGIADVLLDLFEATADEKYRHAALGALQWILDAAYEPPDDPATVAWPAVPGEAPVPPVWCHGAAGIAYFLLHAAKLGLHPCAMELAKKAARACARKARSQGPTLCHGLAGNIELLLSLWRVTGSSEWYEQAWEMATLLGAFAKETPLGLAWLSDEPNAITPDYLVGYAGVGVCLMHLAGVYSPFSDVV
jgi:serine/threonine protein kinase